MDLCVSYYYGPLDKTGYEIIVNNSFFNGLNKIDTSYKKITQSWNQQSLFADLMAMTKTIGLSLTNGGRTNY